MILDAPRIFELGIRLLKPLARLNSILARTHKRNNSLRIVTPGVINCLQKDIIQTIDFSTVLRCSAGDLVNRLKSHHLALARQLGANLEPQLAKSLLESSHIGAGRREVGPSLKTSQHMFRNLGVLVTYPRIMVYIDNSVHATRGNHVNDI